MSGSAPQLDLTGLESAKVSSSYYDEVGVYCCAFAMPDLEMQDGPCHAEFTDLVHAYEEYKGDVNVDWFVESIACNDLEHKPLRDRWLHNLVFNPAVTPYPKFVEYLDNADPLFVITDDYWCFSPVTALEAGFSVRFMLNFLATQRMWREAGDRNMDMLRRFTDDNRDTMLAVVFRNDGFRFNDRHSPFELWTDEKLQRFRGAEPDYGAVFSEKVFGESRGNLSFKTPEHLWDQFPRSRWSGIDWANYKRINDTMEPWIRKELIGA